MWLSSASTGMHSHTQCALLLLLFNSSLCTHHRYWKTQNKRFELNFILEMVLMNANSTSVSIGHLRSAQLGCKWFTVSMARGLGRLSTPIAPSERRNYPCQFYSSASREVAKYSNAVLVDRRGAKHNAEIYWLLSNVIRANEINSICGNWKQSHAMRFEMNAVREFEGESMCLWQSFDRWWTEKIIVEQSICKRADGKRMACLWTMVQNPRFCILKEKFFAWISSFFYVNALDWSNFQHFKYLLCDALSISIQSSIALHLHPFNLNHFARIGQKKKKNKSGTNENEK